MRARPHTRLLPLTAALVAAFALLAGVSGCGGDDEASPDTDPQQLLEETFSGEGQVDSGVLEVSLNASASGEAGGSLSGSLSGPFTATADDQLPSLDFTAALDFESGGGQSEGFEGSITVVEDGAFIETAGAAYKVDDATFSQLQTAFAESASVRDEETEDSAAVFSQLGIDPATWLTDVSNEGTEEVGGAETIHISGTPDVAKILEDAQSLDPTGQTGAVGSEQLAESVTSASIDVYTGAEDKILRRLDLSVALADPEGGGQEVSFEFSIGVSGINEEQEITAPENAQPLEELIPGGLGAAGLGDIAGGGGGTDPGAAPGGGSAAFQECIVGLTPEEALEQCADLL